MVLGTRSLHGRGRELSALTEALDQARIGRGALWLVSGEPGIGKSRLCEEAARLAAERDVSVLWGRCWEAGGAPAYWPFIQVTRALLRSRGAEASARLTSGRVAELAELLPELLRELNASVATAPRLEPEQARFRLLDAVSSLLCDAAAQAPLLIVLEDLHAADASSVLLLDFLSRQLSGAALLVLASYREADLSGAAFESMARLRGQAQVRSLPLSRLGRDEVTALLHDVLGSAPEPALTDAVLEASEGNPLFVGEVARMHARAPRVGAASNAVAGAGASAAVASGIPASLKTAIRQRLRTLSPEAARAVGLASVLGRELPLRALVQLSAQPAHAMAAALDECAAAEVLLEVAPGVLRFSHILLQQVAYAELDEAERSRAHLAFADVLEREARDERASELAHHLLAAGPAAAPRAVAAAIAAARHALAQHAFSDAAELFARALAAQAQAVSTERCELLLELGHAHALAHALDAGRNACAEAAALARELGDAHLFARAALAHGAVYVLGAVSPALVALLQEALQRLAPGDHALRASVMARLAAAMQPAADPEPPIELARQAVAMARRLRDDAALRATLRAACSAMIDLCDPVEVYALCREHAALARDAGDLPDLFRAQLRLAMCASMLGQMEEANQAIDATLQLAEQLRQPHYGWRAAALESMRALWHGDYERAATLRARAAELGARALDPNFGYSIRLQNMSQHLVRGHYDDALEELIGVRRAFAGLAIPLQSVAVYECAVLCRVGQRERGAATLSAAGTSPRAWLFDDTMLVMVAVACLGVGDRALAEEMLAANAPRASRLVTGGVMGMCWELPIGVVCARLSRFLGRAHEATAHYRQALDFLAAHGARGHEAWVAAELAELLCERGERASAEPLRLRARELADALSIAPLVQRMDALRTADAPGSESSPSAAAPAAIPAARGFALRRQGEYWLVEHDGRSFSLRDSKGLSLLARLLQEPGRELHVLDLVGASGTDGGDAGELIDKDARSAYEARVRELREELEEAESFHDLGRAERAQQELDALSRELSRAVGASGRARRGGSAVERARVNVQRRLRDACERIREHDAALGKHLDWALHTGTYCSYRPE